MTALPFSPLTLHELNNRVATAEQRLAWSTSVVVLYDVRPGAASLRRLRELAEDLNAWLNAAEVRIAADCDVSSRRGLVAVR